MLNVQKYLMENGLQKLIDEFKIVVGDYEKFVVLNYNQIESPRFHPVVDECRALILEKGTWKVLCRSFDRFYNMGEGIQQNPTTTLATQRIVNGLEYNTREFDITKAIIETKLDGSLMSMWFYDGKWNVSTRKMAYAEGQTNLGRTFETVFFDAIKETKVMKYFTSKETENYTVTFELIGPENRVVTRYEKNNVVLIGIRDNRTGRELTVDMIDELAKLWNIDRPKYFKVKSYEELINLVKSFPALEEGVVLKIENEDGSHWRLKCKNPSYLAIAHLRNNGAISPKRILALVMANEHAEYLNYFECDKAAFDFVEKELNSFIAKTNNIYDSIKDIESQKEFALKVISIENKDFTRGILFAMRKTKKTLSSIINSLDSEKISKALSLKEKMLQENLFYSESIDF